MKDFEIYHPSKLVRNSPWLLCHVTLWAQEYGNFNTPGFNNGLAPKWYQNAEKGMLDQYLDLQEEYTSELLRWVSKSGITKAFIRGADSPREQQMLESYNVPQNGDFVWNEQLVNILPQLNIHNLYLKAKDGSELIIYESDTQTIFINDPNKSLPPKLSIPQIHEQ